MQGADVSLCVLSLPEVLTDESRVAIPPTLEPLVGPDTFVLLNKQDLTDSVPLSIIGDRQSWAVSLATGEGTKEFLDGFAEALRKR